MIELAISYRGYTRYFNPQRQQRRIYDYLRNTCKMEHQEAAEVSAWAEDAYWEETYETGTPDFEIYFVNDEE